MSRQEPILQEAAARIRRYVGLKQTEKHTRPLIVIVTKCDAWLHLLGESPAHEPWKQLPSGQMGDQTVDVSLHAFDTNAVERWSQMVRMLLLKHCPEIVTGAEGFATQVTYIPVGLLPVDLVPIGLPRGYVCRTSVRHPTFPFE